MGSVCSSKQTVIKGTINIQTGPKVEVLPDAVIQNSSRYETINENYDQSMERITEQEDQITNQLTNSKLIPSADHDLLPLPHKNSPPLIPVSRTFNKCRSENSGPPSSPDDLNATQISLAHSHKHIGQLQKLQQAIVQNNEQVISYTDSASIQSDPSHYVASKVSTQSRTFYDLQKAMVHHGYISSDNPMIDSNLPEGFHINRIQSVFELNCCQEIKKMDAIFTETSIQRKVQNLLTKWDSSGVLIEIENHALCIPPSQTANTSVLAENLTSLNSNYFKAIGDDMFHIQVAKAYIIYFWIANNIFYSVDLWQAVLINEDKAFLEMTDVDSVLDQRFAICSGHAALYKALATKADLKAEIVSGNVKTWTSLASDSSEVFETSKNNAHAWNVVKIEHEWCLLDCTFGSGYIKPPLEFATIYSRHYFAVLPHHFILTHWPSLEIWQVMDRILTLEDQQRLIPLEASVIGMGILPEIWNELIHIPENSDPVAVVSFKVNSNIFLTAKLVHEDQLHCHEYECTGCDVYVRNTYIDRSGEKVIIRAAMPQKGNFVLNVYAKDIEIQSEPASMLRSTLCFSYKVKCDVHPKSIIGYPKVFDLASTAFEFKLLYWNDNVEYICENSGKLNIVFKAKHGLQFYHCLMDGKVEKLNDAIAYHHNTFILSEGDDSSPPLHRLQIIFPNSGWWTVYLCASLCSNPSGYTALLNYQVYANVGLPMYSYPHVLTPLISLILPEPLCVSGREPFLLPFASLISLDFHTYLTHDMLVGEKLEGYTKVRNYQNPSYENTPLHQLMVIFPKPGNWFVHVYCKPKNNIGISFTGALNLHLKVDGAIKNSSFILENTESLKIIHDNDVISFPDNGKPFTLRFFAPMSGVDFIHSIKPHHNVQDPNDGDTPSIDHHTFLSCETDIHVHAEVNSGLCAYDLTVSFPSAGKWTVHFFSGISGSQNYDLAFQFHVHVHNPSPSLCYPKLFPAFYRLNMDMPVNLAAMTSLCDAPEFQLPFYAPKNVYFSLSMQQACKNENYFQQAFIHYDDGDVDMHMASKSTNRILHIVFPKPGEWIIHVFGKTSTLGSKQLGTPQNHWSLFEVRIKNTSFSNKLAFPQIFEPFYDTFNMALDKDDLPLISRVLSLPATLKVPFYSPSNVKFWHDADVTLSNDDEKLSGQQPFTQMLSNSDTGRHEILVEITRYGEWCISLYAQHIEDMKKTWIAVLRHVVTVTHDERDDQWNV